MNTVFGRGKSSDIQSAVNEAVKNFNNPKLIIAVCEYSKFKDAMNLLYKKFNNAIIIGTTGFNYVNDDVVEDNICVWSTSDNVQIKSGVLENVSQFPIGNIEHLEKSVNDLKPGTDNTICFEFCTCSEEMAVSTFNSVLVKNNVPLIGGTSLGSGPNGEKFVFLNGKFYQNACAYVLIKNLNGKIKTYRQNIYKQTPNRFIATKVDVENRTILELNNKKAASVYADCLCISEDQISDYVFKNPLGRNVGGEIFITAIKGAGSNSSIECYKKINTNDVISILDIDDYDSIVDSTLAQIKNDIPKVSSILSINCANRFILFNNKNYTDKFLKKMHSFADHFGVISEGEQFRNQHVNQTMLLAVFE